MKKRNLVYLFPILSILFSPVLMDKVFALKFGDPWLERCVKCGNIWKHTGLDISAAAGKKVYIGPHDNLIFIEKKIDSKGWGEYVVMGNKNNTYTNVVHHLTGIPSYKKGEPMAKKYIGKVYDLVKYKGKQYGNHVHIGFRNHSFNAPQAYRGGLPACKSKCSNKTSLAKQGYPQHKEYFDNPNSWLVAIK